MLIRGHAIQGILSMDLTAAKALIKSARNVSSKFFSMDYYTVCQVECIRATKQAKFWRENPEILLELRENQ